MSNLINKAKDALSGNKSHGSSEHDSSYDNSQSTSSGPHSSNIMNKGDPRVDSDRDGRDDPTSRTGGYGHTQSGQGDTRSYGTEYGSGAGTGAGYGSSGVGQGTEAGYGSSGIAGYGETTHTNPGTYGSGVGETGIDQPGSLGEKALNKLDPRVDSDRDNRNDPTSRVGGYGTQDSEYGSGTGAGYGDTSTTGGGYGSSTTDSSSYGQHSSNLADKVDPRVDSSRETTGAGGFGSSTTGNTFGERYGENDSGFADSDRSRTQRGETGGEYGSGHTGHHGHGHQSGLGSDRERENTEGRSTGLMDKLDPRVNSDKSGGDTYRDDSTRY